MKTNSNVRTLLRACVVLALLFWLTLGVVPAWAETQDLFETDCTSNGSSYDALICYVDTDGNSLGVTDTVIVNRRYTYTAPSGLYVTEDGVMREYQIADKSQAVLRLEPDEQNNRRFYEIVYEPVEDDAKRTWTVVLENVTVPFDDPGRVIQRIDMMGVPGETLTFDATSEEYARIEIDGSIYAPTTACARVFEYTLAAGEADVEQSVYYVPEDYVPPEAYEVRVAYVNIATNDVIDTMFYTASPSMRQDLEIETPETFSQDGIEWVRLGGQERPIIHGFYSWMRDYVVYYRDINDDLHADTVIRIVRAVYADEGGNPVKRSTIAAGTQPGEAIDTGLPTGEDLLVLSDGRIVTADGTEIAAKRIENEETPAPEPDNNEPSDGTDPNAVATDISASAVVPDASAGSEQKSATMSRDVSTANVAMQKQQTEQATSARAKVESLAKTGDPIDFVPVVLVVAGTATLLIGWRKLE